MGPFNEKESEYLKTQKLGRIATVSADGQPHVVPVTYRVDEATGAIEIGGRALAKSKKFRDLQQNPKAAFVVDDLASVQPWTPRGIEIRGRAEVFETGGDRFGPNWDPAWIWITPERVISWGIDRPPFSGHNARSV